MTDWYDRAVATRDDHLVPAGKWTFDDGGRSTAVGFGGTSPTGDCGPRAVAIATGLDYATVYRELAALNGGKRPTDGTARKAVDKFLTDRGFEWVPTMKIGSGCTVHLRADELPAGRLVVRCSRHFAAVVDGIVRDTHDPTRDGTRCVYGYWKAP